MYTDTADFRSPGKKFADAVSAFLNNKKALGNLSALATFTALAIFTWYSGALSSTWAEMLSFMTGDLQNIVRNDTPFLAMFPVILAVVVTKLPCNTGIAFLASKILGKHKDDGDDDFLEIPREGHIFMSFFLLTLFEELFARWFFLGVLTKIPFLSGKTAFYLLFLIGNGIWALVHLYNYDRKEDRHPLRVLPQFFGGCFYAYLYVKFGLVVAVLAHFASNAVLFATHKIQRLNVIDMLLIGYSALCATVSYALLDKPITDILPWFVNNPTFALPGWSFTDYLKAVIFIESVPSIIFGVLAYDRGSAGPKKKEEKAGPIAKIIMTPIILGLIYLLYYLLGFVISEVPFRVLILSILLSFLSTGKSGSAMARTFWVSLPNAYITVCIMQALGFWYSVAWVLIEMILIIPSEWLLEHDD